MKCDLNAMAAIGRKIIEQDNRCTDQPIFVVQRRAEEWCSDDEDYDGVVWLDDSCERIDEEEASYFELRHKESFFLPKGFSRHCYRWRWEYVTACFTEDACKEHIRLNGHNLGVTRIYAEGSYRNEEFRRIRNFLIELAETIDNESGVTGG